jgi:hypothetical protein
VRIADNSLGRSTPGYGSNDVPRLLSGATVAGTTVRICGVRRTLRGAESAAGPFGLWLGPDPLDRDLEHLRLDD